MKICYIGKYYPIQGGVSRTNYWLMLALAQQGVEVHVVTNANEVEDAFRLQNYGHNPLQHPNLTVHHTQPTPQTYIPYANPYLTKLAATATQVIQQHKCDLIYGHYFEPYGLAAYLASQWTGVPFGIRHAGSDVGRLLLDPQLRTAYEQMVLSADYVMVASRTWRRFTHLGVDQEKLYFPVPFQLPTDYFSPTIEPLDINHLLAHLRQAVPATYLGGHYHSSLTKPFDPTWPTIGIYGKTGRAKGSYDLLQALSQLKQEGLAFNFVAITQNRLPEISRFANAIAKHGLADCTWLLPFIPHWTIAQFIRACTAVCFLERSFSITIHTPIVPREVLACGTPLILSREMVGKQRGHERFVDGETVLLVDPQNISELAESLRRVMAKPEASRVMGLSGYTNLSEGQESFEQFSKLSAERFRAIYDDIQVRKAEMSMAEMQACMARLYVDEPFRKLFFGEPEETLAEYKLTEQELAALKGLDKKAMTYFAGSLRSKRKRKFTVAYASLFKLNSAEMNRYYKRFYALYPARPGQNTLSEVIEFGHFIAQTIAPDDDFPPYAVDVAHYERLYYQATYLPSERDAFAYINKPLQQTKNPVTLAASPQLAVGVFINEFGYDMVALMERLINDEPLGDVPAGTQHLVFQQTENSLHPKVFAITPATYTLLDLCTGQQSVADLVRVMEKDTGRANLTSQVSQILTQLQAMELITC